MKPQAKSKRDESLVFFVVVVGCFSFFFHFYWDEFFWEVSEEVVF